MLTFDVAIADHHPFLAMHGINWISLFGTSDELHLGKSFFEEVTEAFLGAIIWEGDAIDVAVWGLHLLDEEGEGSVESRQGIASEEKSILQRVEIV